MASEWVVLAERVGGVLLPHEDSSEVWVVAEADAEHVEDFAFEPFCAGPEVGDGVEPEGGIFFDAVGWDGRVEEDFDEEAVVAVEGHDVVDDCEPCDGFGGVVEIIDAGDVAEEVVCGAFVVLEEREDVVEVGGFDDECGLAAVLGCAEAGVWKR